MNPMHRRQDKELLPRCSGCFCCRFVAFIFLFFPPWWSVARLTDTNLDRTSMCSRPGPRAQWKRSGYGAWRHGETGKPVGKKKRSGQRQKNNAGILKLYKRLNIRRRLTECVVLKWEVVFFMFSFSVSDKFTLIFPPRFKLLTVIFE